MKFFKKETPTQVISCEVYETFKNTYFEGHLQRLFLEVFFKKYALKNCNVYRRKVVSNKCSVKKVFLRLTELSKWRVFILINISCKKCSCLNELFFLSEQFEVYIFDPEFFWLRTVLRELRILNCHCWEMSSVLSKFQQSFDTKLF